MRLQKNVLRDHTGWMVCLLLGICAPSLLAQSFIRPIATGLAQPVFATQSPGDDDRLFVLEKDTGRIQIIDLATETQLDESFLRVSGLRTGGERGLLGMAFHPDYASNGKFYVYASARGGSRNHLSQVLEYQVSGDPTTSNLADPDSRRLILEFEQPFGNHNGGWIGFDPTAEGSARSHLHIATGDGGSANDPENNSQDITNNLLGKILRIDIDRDDFPDDSDANYGIPATNPFVGQSGDDEILAYGLRNPWRNSFDRQTGDLWMGDVGQGALEEISVLPAGNNEGLNFGWRIKEGTNCFRESSTTSCSDTSLVDPVYDYSHGSGTFQGNSVTGGYVYRGEMEAIQGHYIFADFASNNIWSLDPFTNAVASQNSAFETPSGGSINSIASFAETNDGELLVISIGGSVYRLESNSRDARWVGSDVASGTPGDGLTLGDPNNWVRDGVADIAFENGDHLILGGTDFPDTQSLQASRLTFESDATLTSSRLILASGDIYVNQSVTGTVAGGLLDSAGSIDSIRKWGPGRLELTSRVRRGSLVVVEGTAAIQESAGYDVVVEPEATLDQIGSGMVTIDELTMRAGSTLSIDAASTLVVESWELDGMLDVQVDSEFALPDSGDPLVILTSERGGTVELESMHVNGLSQYHLGEGEFVELLATEDSVSLDSFQALAGDTNGDRTVNFADFLTLSGSTGMPGDWLSGDFTGDGQVLFEDFQLLSGNFGLTGVEPEAGLQTASVPEPSTKCLLLASGLLLAGVYRRRIGCR